MKNKFVLLLCLGLCSCAYERRISSNMHINLEQKSILVSSADLPELHQELKQALRDAGYKIYEKNNDNMSAKAASRYELSENIRYDTTSACGLFGEGFAYDVSFIDLHGNQEVFNMQGKGCKNDILNDFNALIRNQYTDNRTPKKEEEDTITPIYSVGKYTLWGQ